MGCLAKIVLIVILMIMMKMMTIYFAVTLQPPSTIKHKLVVLVLLNKKKILCLVQRKLKLRLTQKMLLSTLSLRLRPLTELLLVQTANLMDALLEYPNKPATLCNRLIKMLTDGKLNLIPKNDGKTTPWDGDLLLIHILIQLHG